MLQLLSDLPLGNTLWSNDWFGREMDRFLAPLRQELRTADFRTLVNVYANENAARVLVSVPGWNAEWFDLSAEGNRLTIKGESHFEGKNQPKVTIDRVVNLPFRVDEAAVSASYKNGLLQIDLKRAESDKPRKITVTAA
jgi:HSP20 family protein